jgi:hypothetical protein
MSDSEEDSYEWETPVTREWLEAILASYHQQELHHSSGACSGEDDDDDDDDDEEESGAELRVSIGEFSVGPGCDAGECVLSDILAVRVQYQVSPGTTDTRSLSLIVKLLPHDPFSRFFVTEAQFDLREIKFYTQVSKCWKSVLKLVGVPIF